MQYIIRSGTNEKNRNSRYRKWGRMNPFLLSDIISCKSYEKICEANWNDPSTPIPKSGIVHVPLDNIAEFFRRIKGTSEKYVLVSSCSDFGLTYQREHPIWRDLAKWVALQSRPIDKFEDYSIPPQFPPSNKKEGLY